MKKLLSGLFVLMLILTAAEPARAEDSVLIRDEEIRELFDSYLKEKDLIPELISVGYIFTGTGERWYHNADQKYYSASLYKVPLMMLLAEKEYEGELTQESEICGMPLSYIEEQVLAYSDNPIAYSMLLYLGEPSETRRMFQRYAELPEDYYDWDFYGSSDFTARFITDVMLTLEETPERFPHIAEWLRQAQPEHYFRLKLEDSGCEIAQKYGYYYDDMSGAGWTHASGIFYTEHPFVLTVMTRYGGMGEEIIADLAVLFRDYTLCLEDRMQELPVTPDRRLPKESE